MTSATCLVAGVMLGHEPINWSEFWRVALTAYPAHSNVIGILTSDDMLLCTGQVKAVASKTFLSRSEI